MKKNLSDVNMSLHGRHGCLLQYACHEEKMNSLNSGKFACDNGFSDLYTS